MSPVCAHIDAASSASAGAKLLGAEPCTESFMAVQLVPTATDVEGSVGLSKWALWVWAVDQTILWAFRKAKG